MIFPIKSFLPFFLLTIIGGCGQKPEDLIADWKKKGWSYVTTHGSMGSFSRTGFLKSDKAQAVEASWIEGGKRKVKVYSQQTYHFVVLRFFREDGDEFVVVMRKRK